ncbi:MAG TPA: GspE/PulE family protein [Solirubrobacteraceae bacterium]|jgi:type IV pilus assembly protein PilB|nr:GspE/PulE family protein [Solirubrobacteraceae bacterium]
MAESVSSLKAAPPPLGERPASATTPLEPAPGDPERDAALVEPAPEPEDNGAATAGVRPPSRRGGALRSLTEVFVELGMCTREEVLEAIEVAAAGGTTADRVLLERGVVSPEDVAIALAERQGLDYVDLAIFNVDMAAANLVTSAVAKRHEALPVAIVGDRVLLVAMSDPTNVHAIDDIAILTGYQIRVAVTTSEDISNVISRLARVGEVHQDADDLADDEGAVVELHETADDAPVVRLVHQLVGQAVEEGASDLHISPDGGSDLRVRFRVDGVLRDVTSIPRRLAAGVISRMKIMAELDIAERRVPQDGRVGLTVDGHRVDLRVVTVPTVRGEGVVMRILDKEAVVMDLTTLGMAESELTRFERAYNQSHGAVLVTGPTGSGKSTTLYAALSAVNTPDRHIITIEDPVEYQLDGITQIQVNAKAGLHFDTGLRAIVRADPDVIMVGEIRDRETAQIAIEAALTGHLVLSTLHTNDAATSITRLIEMGIEPFLVASALDCVVAQRLVRVLCAHCKRRVLLPMATLREYGYAASFDVEGYEPVGCKHCGGSGYRGRTGIYEVMTLSAEIRALALERRSGDEILEMAVVQGMHRLKDDGLDKVKQGRTSIAEIARVVNANIDSE